MLPSQLKVCSDFSSSEFLFAVSHELKNPLNAIIGFSDVLRFEMSNMQKSKIGNKKSDNENLSSQGSFAECMDCISEINQAACEMNELIHDLLDVGSGFSGNFSVDLSKEIDVQDVIRRSVKLNYDYSLRRGITLKTEIVTDINPINLDAKRMKQIFSNLISNAIKYSPKNTEIKISAKQVTTTDGSVVHGNASVGKDKFLEISIVDQGFGMTPDQVQTAFQKYQTIPNPNSGMVDSLGLGLPIAKQLVELQNGTIEVKSEINQGTEIKLRFPYQM